MPKQEKVVERIDPETEQAVQRIILRFVEEFEAGFSGPSDRHNYGVKAIGQVDRVTNTPAELSIPVLFALKEDGFLTYSAADGPGLVLTDAGRNRLRELEDAE